MFLNKPRTFTRIFITRLHNIQVAQFHATPVLHRQLVSLEVDVVQEGHLNKKNWIFKEDKHRDMHSFLSRGYAHSNYFTGTKFEYETLLALEKYSFSLERTGKAGDEGVDFKGVSFHSVCIHFYSFFFELRHIWNLPDKQLSIIGQCKKIAKPLGTNVLQQFEGTLSRMVPHSYHALAPNSTTTLVGILVSASGFSKAAASYFMSGVSFSSSNYTHHYFLVFPL